MKKTHLIGSLFASAVVVTGVYITNIGQEMAVRVGSLTREDLHRLPSLTVLREARSATPMTDTTKVMGAFHMILNAQLALLGVTGAGCAALFFAQRKTA